MPTWLMSLNDVENFRVGRRSGIVTTQRTANIFRCWKSFMLRIVSKCWHHRLLKTQRLVASGAFCERPTAESKVPDKLPGFVVHLRQVRKNPLAGSRPSKTNLDVILPQKPPKNTVFANFGWQPSLKPSFKRPRIRFEGGFGVLKGQGRAPRQVAP